VDTTPVVTTNWFAAVGYEIKPTGYELKPLRYKLKPGGFELEERAYRFMQKI